MPKKAKTKKEPKGIAVKQKQTVKQSVKVIVGDIAKKQVRRRRPTKPKVSTLIQPSGGGMSGSSVPEALRDPQPYSYVPDNRQPRYDFERIPQQPIQSSQINLLDYKANHPSVSASGLIGIAEQKKLMDEQVKPDIRDVSKEYNAMEAREQRRLAGIQKRKETLAKKKEEQLKKAMEDVDRRMKESAGSSTETIIVDVKPKRYLGQAELDVGLFKNRDKVLIEKAKAFRDEQRKKRAIQALRSEVEDNIPLLPPRRGLYVKPKK